MHMDQIGSGSTGYVEEVKDRKTGLFYARERIEIMTHSTRKEIQEVFANEVKTIRSLAGHPHFVRVLAAYATEQHFNLVLQPRADEGDLARFLDVYLNPKGKISDSRKVLMAAILEQAFGCLASGLAFMHQQKIRHRDVKPKNILIHKGAVLWADFGYSRDSSLFEHSATKGLVDAQIYRYSAPEVLSWTERDSKADIYSLGCVFLEVFYALAYDKAALEPGKWFSKEMNHLTKEIASA
jgi:serine/threonine protein kinase